MKIIFKIGSNECGRFYVDTGLKKVLKTVIVDEFVLGSIFPKIDEGGYSYQEFEDVMKSYTQKDLDLEEIARRIRTKGFFYPMQPGLHIFVEEFDSI